MFNAIAVLVAATFAVQWGNNVLFGGGLASSVFVFSCILFLWYVAKKRKPIWLCKPCQIGNNYLSRMSCITNSFLDGCSSNTSNFQINQLYGNFNSRLDFWHLDNPMV